MKELKKCVYCMKGCSAWVIFMWLIYYLRLSRSKQKCIIRGKGKPLTFPLNVFYTYRNEDNFTPLHLLNKDSGEELDLLDPDHLLPRANDPVLQENIIEVCVCISIKVRSTILHDVLLFCRK